MPVQYTIIYTANPILPTHHRLKAVSVEKETGGLLGDKEEGDSEKGMLQLTVGLYAWILLPRVELDGVGDCFHAKP